MTARNRIRPSEDIPLPFAECSVTSASSRTDRRPLIFEMFNVAATAHYRTELHAVLVLAMYRGS